MDEAVASYLADRATPAQREQFERVHTIVKRLAPDVTVSISYGIPTFKHKGKYVLYFGVFKDHLSVYPTLGVVEATDGKGTYQFDENNPVPESVVEAIVSHRLNTIDSK